MVPAGGIRAPPGTCSSLILKEIEKPVYDNYYCINVFL